MTDLYKLTQDGLDLERELAEATNLETGVCEMSDEKMGEFFRLEKATDAKIEGYIRLMENLEAKAEIRIAEYNAYAKRIKKHYDAAKAAENKIKRLKEWMKYCMEAAEKDTIETEHFTVKIQKNGGQPAVSIPPNPDFKKWPEELIEMISRPDIEAIREVRRNFPGCALPLGVEVVTGTHIRIR